MRAQRFEGLAAQQRPFLLGLARKLCRSHFDPEDLVQDVLVRALRHYERLPDDANERAWLGRIMHNLFIDRVRRKQAAPTLVPADALPLVAREPDAQGPWQHLTADDVARKVKDLPGDLREIYELHAELRLPYAEIAKRLHIPMGTVATRLLRARRALRALLVPGATNEEPA